MERTDKLRRRPNNIRYYYLAVSENDIHTGASYGGLNYVYKNHIIQKLFFSDLVTKRVLEITEPMENFMMKWRMNYNNPEWNYEDDISVFIL